MPRRSSRASTASGDASNETVPATSATPSTVDQIVARGAAELTAAIRQWIAALVDEMARKATSPARAPRARAAAAGSATAGETGAAPTEGSPAPTAGSTAHADSGAELVEKVRAELHAAFDGRPVTPDRLAFRLKSDRDLVDAALTLLVTRKEAWARHVRGRPAYVPAIRPPIK